MRGTAAVALLALALAAPGCASRRTFGELGLPAFDDALGPDERVRVVAMDERSIQGWIGDEPSADLAYKCQRMVEVRAEGDELVFVVGVAPTGSSRVVLCEAAVFPLDAKAASRYANEGALPDPASPLGKGSGKEVNAFSKMVEVCLRVPRKRFVGFARVALPTLVKFEHGWVTVTYGPTEALPEGS